MPTAFQIVFLVTLLVAAAAPMINGTNRRLLEDTISTTGEEKPDVVQIKCGGCPCDSPCYTTSPPPPSPPPPQPPSPKIPMTPTPGLNCPPAAPTGGGSRGASPGYMYITGPPGDLYPVNPYFSGSHRSFRSAPPLVAVFVLGMLIVY
ncbi:hypothetical protein SSX86_027685 [Deinandra increscens subsp. villosa]|uniref:Uncharacterized protein n=1 Tax=Deinandra increscens subsp. villosa TaxID=3103831 RepID=A0AAP0GK34_9ASTR